MEMPSNLYIGEPSAAVVDDVALTDEASKDAAENEADKLAGMVIVGTKVGDRIATVVMAAPNGGTFIRSVRFNPKTGKRKSRTSWTSDMKPADFMRLHNVKPIAA